MRNPALLTFAILSAVLAPAHASAACSSSPVAEGTNASYVVFMPQAGCYNGDVILFAHGYVPVGSPAGTWLSQLYLPDGTFLPTLVNGLGFGFAASGYSKDGLAILQGIGDTKALEGVITGLGIPVNKYFVTGASEGGLIAAKSVENDPTYAGGVAVCGPLGSFRKQINYFGDVRVLFDYFFPGVLPGSAININPALIAGWGTYETAIRNAVNSRPLATLQLLNTAQIPVGLSFSNAADSIIAALWYNVWATTDAQATLGGNPYDNIGRHYTGSFNDFLLNLLVERDPASQAALSALQNYETSGLLGHPLVTLHTLADPVIPYWQETLYGSKVASTGSSSELAQIPAPSYGHCNVTATEAEAALLALFLKTGL